MCTGRKSQHDWYNHTEQLKMLKRLMMTMKVSEHTAHRNVASMSLHSMVTVPMLSPVYCRNFLQWAGEHQNWIIKQYKNVAQSG